ncbi:hypothetical protein Tco_1357180 [Tanacetum coccineum]
MEDLYTLCLCNHAATLLPISSEFFECECGSPPLEFILFGDIPTVIPSTSVVAPETSTIAHVISSAAPVVETTLSHNSPHQLISHFLCTDSSEAPDSSDDPPHRQDPYVATCYSYEEQVTTDPSSSSEFPIAPVTALPEIL